MGCKAFVSQVNKKKKLNIIFVSREYPPSKRLGGIATYLSETAKYLAADGHNVYVLAASDNVLRSDEYQENGVSVIRLSGADFYIGSQPTIASKFYSQWRRFFYHKSYRRKIANFLVSIIEDHNIDIIEFAEYGNESLVWAKKHINMPWIIRLHGSSLLDRATGARRSPIRAPFIWYFGVAEIMGLKRADAISACSRSLGELEADFASLPHTKVTNIPNAIDFRKMQPPQKPDVDEYEGFFKQSTAYHLFSAGSVVEGKGYGDLVKAIQILKEKGIDISLTIAGKWGALGRKLNYQITVDNDYEQWLHLPGKVPRETLPYLYAKADIVAFPSWWEPQGIVLLEAMAAGGLVIGSTAGGMSEVIDDSENGFLVEPHSPTKLAEKIKQVLKMSNVRQHRIRMNAQDTIKNDYDIARIMEKQVAFYLSTIIKYKSDNT